jgi:Homeodomain-like domain
MPRPTPEPIRTAILRRCRDGQDAARIAAELSLPPRTVRRLVRRLRDGGEEAIRPDYRRPAAAAAPDPIREAAGALRREHPRWGAPLIRSLLLRDHPDRPVPSARALQRWFRRHGPPRPPRPEAPEPARGRAARPHDVWQIDAS